jgi:membrane protein YqaA with SNARE-associated domain
MDALSTDPAHDDHGATAGAVEHAPRGTRLWFAAFIAWMVALALGAALLLTRYEAGDAVALRAWILVLVCFYLSLCNSFLPLPTAWIVLLAAAPEYALIPVGWLNILVVALLSTLATIVANLNEYHLLAVLLGRGLGRRARRTRVYTWAARWFERAPFALLTLIAFVPIPVDAVRWLAILQRYPRGRFALAYLLGRGPRYVIFAGCSVLLALSGTQILLIQIVLIVLALLGRLVWGRLRPAGSGIPVDVALAGDSAVGRRQGGGGLDLDLADARAARGK